MTSNVSARQIVNTSRVLLFFVFLTFGAIIVQTWLSIIEDETLTLATERENGLVAVRLLEEHATQTLRDAERNLNDVLSVIDEAGKKGELDDALVSKLIAQEKLSGRFSTTLEFIGSNGKILVSSPAYPQDQAGFESRRHILFLIKHPLYKQIAIGNSFRRNHDAELAIPLAHNVHDKAGRFLGIISIDVSVSNFSKVYERIASGGNALVALFSDDGRVLVRSPFDERFMNMDISTSPVLLQLKGKAAEGSFDDSNFLSGTDATPRLYTYHKVEGFAVTAVFGRSTEAILVDWKTRTIDRILYAGVFIVIHLILTYYLAVHIRRLHNSEASLVENIGRLNQSEALLRASETKFASMFQYSPVPLSVMRLRDGHIIDVNDSLLSQFGINQGQFTSQTPLLLWNDVSQRQPYLELLIQQKSIESFEVQMRHQDGRVLFCLLSARIFDIDGEEIAIFSPIDVTREREIENQIRELNHELEERVRRRTDNLEMSNAELANAMGSLKNAQGELLRAEKMAALGSLVAGVAHELNTPIGNSVTVSSTVEEWILKMDEELKSPKPRRALLLSAVTACMSGTEILRRNLERAAELVTSFKQVAVDQSSNQRRKFDLRYSIEEVLLTLRPMYVKTGFRLEHDLEPKIDMDSYPGAIGQIVTNFVTNALAHAFDGRDTGVMRIEVHRRDDQAEIVFSDDGVGIPEQYLKRVFDPFFTTKLGKGGSGLGMHIVYNLITDVLGGKVLLTSRVGIGTKLAVTLPLRAPDKETVMTDEVALATVG
jgi:PAS domain S-box-containing protein